VAATASHVWNPVTAIFDEENKGTPENFREYPDDIQEKKSEGAKKKGFFL